MTRKNILFVLLDGCRAQSLGCYGYAARATSPFIDGLADRGAVVDQAYGTSNCTMPSVVSMMTGVYPAQHRAAGTWSYYDGRFPFLTDLLRRNSYQTYYVSNTVTAMSPEWGFIRGYDRAYRVGREVNWFRDAAEIRRGVRRDPFSIRVKKDLFKLARHYVPDKAEALRRNAQLQWYREHDRGSAKAVECVGRMLSERDASRPFFMFVNLPDAHSPYLAVAPFDRAFGDLNVTPNLLDLNLVPAEFYDNGLDLSAEERATLVQMYDTCVRYVDDAVRRLHDMLEQAGVAKDTIIVLAGDHGGMTYEHRQFNGAGSFSYEPEIRVPVILSGAGVTGRIGGLHSVVDLFPTLLELCDITIDADPRRRGKSLLSRPEGHDRILVDYPRWPEWLNRRAERSFLLKFGKTFRTMIKPDGTKLIWVHDGSHEQYDLAADPQERANHYSPAGSLPLINEMITEYEALIGPLGRRLEIYEHNDVGAGVELLPPISQVNPAFDSASVVIL